MRIVVSAQGSNLDAPASPVFGRCPTYMFVDTGTLEFEAVPNPAMNQAGAAAFRLPSSSSSRALRPCSPETWVRTPLACWRLLACRDTW
jgi:hypothetical protein